MYLASVNHRGTVSSTAFDDQYTAALHEAEQYADTQQPEPAEACTDCGADMPSRPRAHWLDRVSGAQAFIAVWVVAGIALWVALPWGEVLS